MIKDMTKRFFTLLALAVISFSAFAQMPVVGISGTKDGSTHQIGDTYVASVRNAGGIALIIPLTTDDDQIAAIVETIDALVMTGGEDFDPLKWYGEEPLPGLGSIFPERDEFDVKLVRAAVAKGIPVLGICRGEQLINIAFGGTLYQDIPSQVSNNFVKHRQGPTPSRYATHTAFIEKGSFLENCLGRKCAVNSFHHQAVKDVAPGFKVIAKSADGIVEGIERVEKLKGYEDGGAIIIGTQFHPEAFAQSGQKEFLEIFRYLISNVKK